jgi:hypothetical protein
MRMRKLGLRMRLLENEALTTRVSRFLTEKMLRRRIELAADVTLELHAGVQSEHVIRGLRSLLQSLHTTIQCTIRLYLIESFRPVSKEHATHF